MSGRSRVTLADGRRVTGFRKTLRRNPRSAVRPEWRMVLILPPTVMVSPGPHGYGVNVVAGEKDAVLLDVQTFSIDEAVQRAGDFLHRYARHLAPLSIVATITCSAWPADTKTTRWITIGGDIVATRSMARPLALRARP